jgi:DNA-binding response OmpR family regulator
MSTEKNETVLIVEDNPLTLQALIEYLQKLNLTTTVAHSGEEALRQVGETKPALILLDIMLPGIDGFETCSRLKANPLTCEIPVIFLTALTDTESKVKAYEIGGVDYITKPFDFQEVAIRVDMRLTFQRLQRRLQIKSSVMGSVEGIKNRNESITILIVDDNPLTLEAIVAYLRTFGFTLLTARSGDDVIEHLPQPLPDLILLDVMMPGRDGFATCRWLKRNPKTKHIPVIFMTALTDMEDKIKAFEAGGTDYVMKPHHYAEILNRINTHLTIRTLQRQLREQRRK